MNLPREFYSIRTIPVELLFRQIPTNLHGIFTKWMIHQIEMESYIDQRLDFLKDIRNTLLFKNRVAYVHHKTGLKYYIYIRNSVVSDDKKLVEYLKNACGITWPDEMSYQLKHHVKEKDLELIWIHHIVLKSISINGTPYIKLGRIHVNLGETVKNTFIRLLGMQLIKIISKGNDITNVIWGEIVDHELDLIITRDPPKILADFRKTGAKLLIVLKSDATKNHEMNVFELPDTHINLIYDRLRKIEDITKPYDPVDQFLRVSETILENMKRADPTKSLLLLVDLTSQEYSEYFSIDDTKEIMVVVDAPISIVQTNI